MIIVIMIQLFHLILILLMDITQSRANNITVSASINPVIHVSFDEPMKYYRERSESKRYQCTEPSIFAETIQEAVLNFRLPIGVDQTNEAAISPDLTLAPDGTYRCTSDDCKDCIATLEKFFRARKYQGETDDQLLRRYAPPLKRYCNKNFKFVGANPPPAPTPPPPLRRRPPHRHTRVRPPPVKRAQLFRQSQSVQQPAISTIPFPITETIIIGQRFWARRYKRQIRNTDIVRKLTLDCYNKGEEIKKDRGYAGLCNWCWVLYQLTDEYSPRFVNDIECGRGNRDTDIKCLKGVGVCRATDKKVKHNRRGARGNLETYERSVKVNCECRFDISRSNTCAILP